MMEKDIKFPVFKLSKIDATGVEYEVVDEGNVDLQEFVGVLGGFLTKRGKKYYVLMGGEVTWLDIERLKKHYGY